ncbi:MAG: glycosyltransferase family 4 protein [Nitrospirota bacterium]
MKVCIDATPIGIVTPDKGGVYRYIFELIRGLSFLDSDDEYTLFFNFSRKEHLPVFHEVISKLGLGKNFRIRHSKFPVRFRRIMEPPMEFLAGKFDIFHACFDYFPRILSGRGIVTIHDIRYLEEQAVAPDSEWVRILKETNPAHENLLRDYAARADLFHHLSSTIRKTIRRAHMVITVSEFCRGRLMELLKLPDEKIRVVYHGVDKRFLLPLKCDNVLSVLNRFGIERPYVLYTGKFDPSKNLIRLLEAFGTVCCFHDIVLVMVGPKNWFYHIIHETAKKLGIDNRIKFTGFVDDDDLVSLYNGASVFALPSLYEGFGIPLLEAMACGVPVVASNVCSVPEVIDDAGILVDPLSIASIAEGIRRVLSDTAVKNDLVQKGLERAKLFSWEKTARETREIYRKVYRG